MKERALGPVVYLEIWFALMVLFAITAVVAWIPLGPFNVAVAIGVAVCKAALIILYFMHVRVSRALVWLAAAAGFTWLGILLVLSMSDFLSRGVLGIPGK